MAANTLCRMPHALFEQIFLLLMLEPCDSDGKMVGCHTVACLARTCRYFHIPAVNVLWHTIPDIAILFFALPRHRYHVKRLLLDETDKTMMDEKIFASTFAGTPVEAGLVRFFSYARRVKVIQHRCYHLPPQLAVFCADPETYHALAVILQDRPLLPNVESIEFHRKPVVSTAVFRSFHILFGPKLKKLSMFGREGQIKEYAWLWRDPALGVEPQEEQDFEGMLAELGKRVPHLEALEFNLYPSGATMALATSVALDESRFGYLTSLCLLQDCLPIRPEAFVSLGYLPSLRTLEFSSNIAFWTDADFVSLIAEDPLFPVLRSLSITGTTLAVPIMLLQWVSSPCLASLTVSTDADTVRGDIDPLIVFIAALPSRDTLSVLSIHVPDVLHETVMADTARIRARYNSDPKYRPSRRRARAPEPLFRATFAPLLAMHSLEEVVLDIHCPLDLDDALLESFGRAWPKLRLLNIGAPSPWGTLTTDVRVGEVHDVPPFVLRKPAPPPEDGTRAAPPDDDDDDSDTDTDAEFADIEMMGAWTPPRVTLLGLLAFAAHVPLLTELGLDSFDATLAAVPPARLEQRPARGVVHGRLRTLHVALSPIADPWAVAAVLADAFPGLAEVDCRWKSLEDDEGDREGPERVWWSLARMYGRRWESVGELVPKFVKVRLHERTRKRKAAGVCSSEDTMMRLET
ncbi:hypothetical protein TRAPUB_13655 [Trametes pubescens]|uniref:F-box domain-containing protein n=1 Tax=Trametes pubescens TaxID=154538 RepID=A0A1M2VQZ2_TRAPU|nr:hypothetical protein TRAPUB_13655 [Trametes pubescens]